jgi:aromatic O-demethylase, cytochrome P450 subunit
MAIAPPIDVVADIALEDLERDPYPHYARLRDEAPVAWIPSVGRVHVATWDLCSEAGRNFQVFGPTADVFNRVYGEPNVMSVEGGLHRELRDAVREPFLAGRVAGYAEAALRPVAVRVIEAIRERGRAEISTELCEPISLRAIGDLVGFPDVADGTLQRWFYDYGAYLVDLSGDPEIAARAATAKAEVRAYLERRHDEIVAAPDGTAIASLLTHGRPPGQPRPIDDVIATVGVIIVGGFQEPAHGTANAFYGLLGQSGQADLVAAEPRRWSEAVMEEGLRWLAPFNMTEKLTTAPVELGGVRIPAGTEIAMGIGSANRDPARYTDPDRFDIARPDQRHVSFGFGNHFCIGNIVARALGRIVIEEAFVRLENLRLDPDEDPVVHGWYVRAAKRLPLVWDV